MDQQRIAERQEWESVTERCGLLISVHPVGWTCDKPILFRAEIHNSAGRCVHTIGMFTNSISAKLAGLRWVEARA